MAQPPSLQPRTKVATLNTFDPEDPASEPKPWYKDWRVLLGGAGIGLGAGALGALYGANHAGTPYDRVVPRPYVPPAEPAIRGQPTSKPPSPT